MSTAFAGITVSAADSQGTSMGDDSINVKFLPALLVDVNSGGLMPFSGPQIRAADATGANFKFRFWVNDDDDRNNEDHPGSGQKDCADNQIQSLRDLEDFARLHLYFGGLQAGIADGTFKVGLKWKNTGALKPVIKVFHAVEADGGTAYLSNEATAAEQIGGDYKTVKAMVSAESTTAAILPASVFANFSTENPVAHLLFEGVSEGKGELVVTLHKSDGTEIGEGPGVWLDITDIKKMYQSSEGNLFVETPPGETPQTVVFVHGWNMSPEGSRNYAETMFKRLWHRGYKGRFAYFRWNTHWLSTFDVIGTLTTQYFSNYNNSEYEAWTEGAPSLKSFVASLPYAKNIVAHSMGNIVVGEAMRLGMQVNNCALMQPSVPAACYDEREVLKQTTTYQHSFIGLNFTMWDEESPDDDLDETTRNMAYRGALKNIGQNGNLILFYLPNDEATSYAWELNNDITKPSGFLSGHFRYNRSGQSGQKLYKDYGEGLYDYFWTSRRETMSFACRTWSKAAGADGRTQGAIEEEKRVDLSEPQYQLPGEQLSGFGDEHSGQFKARIQNLKLFYDELMFRLNIGTPNP